MIGQEEIDSFRKAVQGYLPPDFDVWCGMHFSSLPYMICNIWNVVNGILQWEYATPIRDISDLREAEEVALIAWQAIIDKSIKP